jgi:hypothetical protein
MPGSASVRRVVVSGSALRREHRLRDLVALDAHRRVPEEDVVDVQPSNNG